MENWLLLQTFYHRLSTNTRKMMDATAGGAFLSLHLLKLLTLWKRWHPINLGMRNVNPARKKEECTSSRR
jgi:hypothetical protein